MTDIQYGEVGKRLKELRESLVLTQDAFGEKIKYSQNLVSENEGGGKKNKEGVKSIASRYLDMVSTVFGSDRTWLETGKGEMFMPVKEASQTGQQNPQNAAVYPVDLGQEIQLPFISISARASFIESFLSDSENEEMGKYPVLYKGDPKDLSVIEILGDSMLPKYEDRDKVLARKINPDDWKYTIGNVAVLYKSYFVVKRILQNDLTRNGTLTLTSINPAGGVITVREDEILAVWKIVRLVDREEKD